MPHAVARRARPPEAGNHEVVKAGMDIGRLVPYPAGVLDIWGGLRFGTTISTAAEMQPTASWILLWGHYGPLWDGRPRPADRRVRHKPSPKRACCRAPIGGRPLRIIHQAYAIIKSQRAWRGVRRESRAVSWPPEVSVGNLYGIPKFEQGEGGSRSLVAGTGYGVRRSPTRSLKSIYPTTRQARRRAYAARMERHLLGLSENWDWFYVWVAVAFSILHRPQSACLVPSCS